MKRLIVSFVCALAALGGLLTFAAWEEPESAAAQEALVIEVRTGSETGPILEEGEWYVSERFGDENNHSDIHIWSNRPGVMWVEFEIEGSGSRTSTFFRGFAGARFEMLSSSTYPDNKFTDSDISVTCAGTGWGVGSMTLENAQSASLCGANYDFSIYAYDVVVTGAGSISIQPDDADRGSKRLRPIVNDSTHFTTDPSVVRFRWFYEAPEPVDYCPDGTEALTETVTLSPTQVFSTSLTGYDWQRVRYVYGGENRLQGTAGINYVHEEFNTFYLTNYVTWTRTVPAYSSVAGPQADLYFENQSVEGREIDLLSACVIPAEPQEYCQFGIELITDTVTIEPGEIWASPETWTPWSAVMARYTFLYNESVFDFYEADLTLNDVTRRRDWMQPLGGGLRNTEWVPNVTHPEEDDYRDPGFVAGPYVTAEVAPTSLSDEIILASVCVEPVIDPGQHCEDGIELVNNPIYLEAFGSASRWSAATTVTSTHIVARIVIEDPTYGDPDWQTPRLRAETQFVSGNNQWIAHMIDYTRYQLAPAQYITATVPHTGSVQLHDSNLTVNYANFGEPHLLRSVCILDAPAYNLSPDECKLYNPDFGDELNDWNTSGNASWYPGVGFLGTYGMAQLDSGGGISQTALMDRGDVVRYEIVARNRGTSTGLLTYGTDTTSLLAGGEQLYDWALDSEGAFTLIQHDMYFSGVNSGDPSEAWALGDGVRVDYICLRDSSALVEEVDCILPEWDPPGVDGILTGEFTNWVWNFMGRLVTWAVCEILMAINRLWLGIRDFLMAFPALPEGGDVMSWLEWIGQAIARLGDYLGGNLTRLASWFPRNGEIFVQWFIRLLLEILAWILEQFGVEAAFLVDLRDLIYYDLMAFVEAVAMEVRLEWAELVRLMQATGDIFLILINGFSSGVSGTEVAPLGQDVGGIGQFIWDGVDFFNNAIQGTPLIALNILALGILAFGLGQWTLQKFLSILESLQFS